MKKSDFSPDGFLSGIYSGYVSPYENTTDAVQTGEDIRKSLEKLLAFERIPAKTKQLEPVVLKSEKRKFYTLEKLSVEICDGWNMLCYRLLPYEPNGTGVVAVCGHGYGVRQIIRCGKNGKYRTVNFLDNYQKNFAHELAVRGNTVLAFEPIGFGEARLKADSKKPFYISSCETVSMHSLLYGLSTASLRVYQARRCLDLLEAMNCKSLGIMGISGGGLVSLYTACVDLRVEKTVISGYVNTFKGSVLARWHCQDNYIPGIMEIGEMYDFASAIAPRKLLLECGKNDRFFPLESSQFAAEKIKAVYSRLGADENFKYDFFDGKHSVSGKMSFDFFC